MTCSPIGVIHGCFEWEPRPWELQACDERELPVLALSSWQQDAIWRIDTFSLRPARTDFPRGSAIWYFMACRATSDVAMTLTY
jgi:hypothetical protein